MSAAEPGLTAPQRGNLLHEVLHAVWAGSPNGISTHAELVALTNVEHFVEAHVQRVFEHELPTAAREQMPTRYLKLEEQRLTRLVAEWLRFEAERLPFKVQATEQKRETVLAGVPLRLRLDRVDELMDGSLLIIDYKSGEVSPRSWQTPRPEDAQLPLYAAVGLGEDADSTLGGVVFAKVRTGKCEFAGRLGAAKKNLHAELGKAKDIVKNELSGELLLSWREELERLAAEFLAGQATVDPLDRNRSCALCGLEGVCRVDENNNLWAEAEQAEAMEVEHE